jgi:Bacterial extracellular solute-binding proteins, family 3
VKRAMVGWGCCRRRLWAALLAPALAEGSRLDSILETHILRVGTTGDYRPFTALDKKSGEYFGFDIDMARRLSSTSGCIWRGKTANSTPSTPSGSVESSFA